ncbi:MAG: U32 family peptidase [Bacteroidales bacterium]|nr:U32 family peptidase [Bacteroidales bacterium]
MKVLELLAPAGNADIGIAAIDCGADAVYIAGPRFGARKAAGNPFPEIGRLCGYAHRFGARVFVTFNTVVEDGEWPLLEEYLEEAAAAGADAFIIRDMRISALEGVSVPLHASTQCAIRTVEDAERCVRSGCERVVLERQLSLERIREISSALSGTEVEFFVHGALCVGYSGECGLSEFLDGRSGDRGDCVQACRSLYDLVDSKGRVLAERKALLSLKDLRLSHRLKDLVDAGVTSFKIEGRLKNASYVKNVVREYDRALQALVSASGGEYRRASFGRPEGGFEPDSLKTFNRGYTELWLDGRRGRWASADAPKSMGEPVGVVARIVPAGAGSVRLAVCGNAVFKAGDGLCFIGRDSISGFRVDRVEEGDIICKRIDGLEEGVRLFRNSNAAFERELERNMPVRLMEVGACLRICRGGLLKLSAGCENGARTSLEYDFSSLDAAWNTSRALAMIKEGLEKRSGIYRIDRVEVEVEETASIPLLPAAAINGMRRDLCRALDDFRRPRRTRALRPSAVNECEHERDGVLLRSKYCVRYEMGLCPAHQGAADTGPLFLMNGGRRLSLHFDCTRCEMSVMP